jgi:predicted SAM-dependent methyltransferase
MELLNIGCGKRFHSAWTNIDIKPADPAVMACNILEGLPFDSNSFDGVYHSHVLEHLSKAEGERLLRECLRVLKPSGVLRVAVPDLERIARTYLEKLDAAAQRSPEAEADYEWMMLEMYDQTVREKSGGEMASYLQKDHIPNKEFIVQRLGEEAKALLDAPKSKSARRSLPLMQKLKKAVLKSVLGEKGLRALEIGKFRMGGEVHRWMYDRHSLGKLLHTVGFANARVTSPTDSSIQGWNSYHLDTLPDGTVIKPDSLFMEAVKPA